MAHIDVLTGRPIGTVDRRIFGSVTEHLGRCVNGGVVDEASPGSFRADVLAAVRDLGVTNVRWPLTSGPGAGKPGRYGTSEFLAWCVAAGVEPVLGASPGGRPRPVPAARRGRHRRSRAEQAVAVRGQPRSAPGDPDPHPAARRQRDRGDGPA